MMSQSSFFHASKASGCIGRSVDTNRQYSYTATMKATIDIPDLLYRRIKAHSALSGRSVRELTIEMYERILAESPLSTSSGSEPSAADTWLEAWQKVGDEIATAAVDRRTTREILVTDRGR